VSEKSEREGFEGEREEEKRGAFFENM